LTLRTRAARVRLARAILLKTVWFGEHATFSGAALEASLVDPAPLLS